MVVFTKSPCLFLTNLNNLQGLGLFVRVNNSPLVVRHICSHSSMSIIFLLKFLTDFSVSILYFKLKNVKIYFSLKKKGELLFALMSNLSFLCSRFFYFIYDCYYIRLELVALILLPSPSVRSCTLSFKSSSLPALILIVFVFTKVCSSTYICILLA